MQTLFSGKTNWKFALQIDILVDVKTLTDDFHAFANTFNQLSFKILTRLIWLYPSAFECKRFNV